MAKNPKKNLGPDYNLLTCHPEIASEWDYETNRGLLPENEYPKSNNRRSWICMKCGYKWFASVASRTSQGGGCRACQNRAVTENNNLAKLRPEVALEWHPTKNLNLTPFQVVPGANLSVWWKCKSCSHDYKMPVRQKTRGDGCPYCSRNGASPENNLARKFPEIAAQWHPTKNGDQTPDRIAPSSNFRAWWLCPKCGHPWSTKVVDRTNYNTGCNACAGKVATPKHNLAVLFPELARELHPNMNGDLVPEKIRPGSRKKFWWMCPLKHEYQAAVVDRTARNRGCPYCAGRKVGYGNSLADNFPGVAAEWHPTKNEGKLPCDVVKFSGVKVWWKCDKNPDHEWEATVSSRTFQGSGCPHCSPNVSKAELRLFSELKQIFPDILRSFRDPSIKQECDIFLPKYSVAIEYDGKYHHRDKVASDKNKEKILLENGVQLLRVRENPLPAISDWHVNVDGSKRKEKQMVDKVLGALASRIRLSKSEEELVESYFNSTKLINEHEYQELISSLPGPPYERSLAFLHPDISAEWDYEENGPRAPADFYANSTYEVAWIGKKCGHKWRAPIYHRTASGGGCRYCAHKKVLHENSLACLFPELIHEWHPTLNGDSRPETVFAFSSKEAYWINDKRGVFVAKIVNRTMPLKRKRAKKNDVQKS